MMTGYKIFWKKPHNGKKHWSSPDYVFIDEDLLEQRGFCNGCEAVEEEEDLHYSSCPAGWNCLDKACARHDYIEEISEIVDALNERLDAVCMDRIGDVNIVRDYRF